MSKKFEPKCIGCWHEKEFHVLGKCGRTVYDNTTLQVLEQCKCLKYQEADFSVFNK